MMNGFLQPALPGTSYFAKIQIFYNCRDFFLHHLQWTIVNYRSLPRHNPIRELTARNPSRWISVLNMHSNISPD